jgi:hypothetical protein
MSSVQLWNLFILYADTCLVVTVKHRREGELETSYEYSILSVLEQFINEENDLADWKQVFVS